MSLVAYAAGNDAQQGSRGSYAAAFPGPFL
nr:hypothetical protein [Tanacetum cinerariifolium]